MQDITIACICMHSEVGEVERNLDRADRLIDQAISQGAEIVCLPEASISGYFINKANGIYDAHYCQEIIGRIAEMAKAKGVVLMAGMIEIEASGAAFITHVVAGPRGLMGTYRKTHLSPMEQGNFQEGQEIKIFEHDGVIFGIELCWEAHFPEITTIMALRGAEIIFMPHASPRTGPQEKLDSWLRHMRGRAFDNAVYVAACNQVGRTSEGYVFPGVAVIISPSGQVMAQMAEEGEGMIVAELKAEDTKRIKTHRLRYFLPGRRPELYGELIKKNPIGQKFR